ncbi:TonB-dependent receptor [Leptospira ryugenii]|uniref:TonB-dependent receptor n=1 Tax=Leptospira ryugenii TaxID=1917863 RepID=A0A2P2E085_9LEPT|nr:TonB-dependent receptor [Leptospira ryugenii]
MSALSLLAQDESKEPSQTPSNQQENKEESGIQVKGKRESDRGQMNDIEGTNIYAGKKSEVIRLEKTNANLALNNTRQIYAKVPGITIWENEGSGIQPGIGARGLSPNRNWEFNTRMNGYDISSDVFGYPEAYFNPPMESLEKIEIIRGAASLQYGPQFGGMVNYVTKKADPNKPAKLEMKTTGGSYNTLNAYASISGTVGKFSYFTYVQSRTGDGWRDNADYKTQAGYVNLAYQATEKLKVSLEFTKSNYESRQPGGLTDMKFWDNPRQSLRTRNWFSAPWNVPALQIDYEHSSQTRTQIKFFGLYGERNSIGFTQAPNRLDSISPITLQFGNRQVDRDWYRNFGMEARQIIGYQLFDQTHSLSFGVRYYNANTDRIRNPNGNNGVDYAGNYSTDYDIREVSLPECFDGSTRCRTVNLKFSTLNYSAFAENLFRITDKLSITPGVRYEWIRTTGSGRINEKLPSNAQPFGGNVFPQDFTRSQVLYGLGAQYQITKHTNFYSNYSKAYRPVTFAEIYASNATYNTVDPNLKDQYGYNLDGGYRGKVGTWFQFDVGAFELRYNNRVGLLPGAFPGQLNTVTNVGDSLHRGVEAYLEVDPILAFSEQAPYGSLSFFTSSANVNARYIRWQDPRLFTDPAIYSGQNLLAAETYYRIGNLVENAPSQIHRYGVTYHFKNTFSLTYLISYTGMAYSDAANTVTPSADGQIGKIPRYMVRDISFRWTFVENYSLTGGVNNLGNERYFTRRSGGYPGPGILPAEGIFYYIGLSVVL